MAATALEIRVSAMFPSTQPSGWKWVHCLTFPVATLDILQFSPYPYKWIRYSTGVVVGARGHLSFSSDVSSHNYVDYDLGLLSNSAHLFYHTSDIERQRMFPVDPGMGRTHITSSDATTRRGDFRSDLITRDGACVLTGYDESLCDAAHLMPHGKGNDYIQTYTQRRSRDLAGSDIVNTIDDARNGILLNKFAHSHLGTHIAFLMTPNFAMNTTDIDPAASPAEKRCTAHLFVPNKPEYFGNHALPSGSRVRMSPDGWPPNVLFDAVYATTVLLHFASQTFRDMLDEWNFTFYPKGIRSAARANHAPIVNERAVQREKRNKQNHERNKRAAKRHDPAGDDLDGYFDTMILPYVTIPPDELEAFWREAQEMKAAEQRSRLADKVVSWSKGVANASHP